MTRGTPATLIEPYRGYYNIILLYKEGLQWSVEVCGAGCIILVYEDEFIVD